MKKGQYILASPIIREDIFDKPKVLNTEIQTHKRASRKHPTYGLQRRVQRINLHVGNRIINDPFLDNTERVYPILDKIIIHHSADVPPQRW